MAFEADDTLKKIVKTGDCFVALRVSRRVHAMKASHCSNKCLFVDSVVQSNRLRAEYHSKTNSKSTRWLEQ